MYARILDVERFVKLNGLKEITNPIYLLGGRPTSDGLFSYEIFGITPDDRSNIWAYIDLGQKYLHPLAAINLRRYSRNIEYIISGTKNFKFIDGEFVEAQDGETGIDFLYENYDKIKWKNPKTIFPAERVKFLQQDKDKLFISKFPVVPPFYRDINEGSDLGIHEVNEFYKKLIQQSSTLKKRASSFALFSHMTRANVQNTLIDIFNYFVFKEFHGKHGIMRRNVMGVDVDRGVRLVMSAPVTTGKRYTDMQVSFDRTGVPLAAVIAMSYEFILKGVKDFFDNEFIRGGKYPFKMKNGEVKYLTFLHPDIDFSEEVIRKKMDQFVDGPSTRFESIKIPKNKEGVNGYMYITGRFGEATDTVSSRPATWTDVFFLIANKVVGNKGISVTRYPVEDFYAIFHTKMSILSTVRTTYAKIGDMEFKHYPIVEVDKDSSNSFADTLVPSNVYLEGIGGDYDGDMVSIRMAWTDEANKDIEGFMRDKKNFIGLMGNNMRTTHRDFVQCLYSLTKKPKGVPLNSLK